MKLNFLKWILLRIHKIILENLKPVAPRASRSDVSLLDREQAFGYTLEDTRTLMAPMATTGQEAIGSMGTDTPISAIYARRGAAPDVAGGLYDGVASLRETPRWGCVDAACTDRSHYSLSLSGDTLAVGAYFEESNATGVNGDQTDNSASGAGAVYVFVRDPSTDTWSQQAYLKASNTGVSDYFGTSVALSGDTLAVGAHEEDSNATGVDGDQTNNSASSAGAAYVLVRDPAVGRHEAVLFLGIEPFHGTSLSARRLFLLRRPCGTNELDVAGLALLRV